MHMSELVFQVLAIMVAVTVHEFAHAAAATWWGDPTPKRQGRLTVNPLKHIDGLGFLLLLFIGYGWSKPVNTNPTYFKDRKKGTMVTAMAGPIANILLAVILAICLRSLDIYQGMVWLFLGACIRYNIAFCIFNLLPIPPLDGSKLLQWALPARKYFWFVQNVHMLHVILLLLLFLNFLPSVLNPIVNGIVKLLFMGL